MYFLKFAELAIYVYVRMCMYVGIHMYNFPNHILPLQVLHEVG